MYSIAFIFFIIDQNNRKQLMCGAILPSHSLYMCVCVCVCLFVLYSFHICSTNKTKDKTNNPSEEKQNLKVNRRVDT